MFTSAKDSNIHYFSTQRDKLLTMLPEKTTTVLSFEKVTVHFTYLIEGNNFTLTILKPFLKL